MFDCRLTSDKLFLLLEKRKIDEVERMDLDIEIGWIIEYIKSMEKVKEYRKKEKKCLIRKFHEKCKRISWKN